LADVAELRCQIKAHPAPSDHEIAPLAAKIQRKEGIPA
jgi:hypothetical protein